MNEKMKSILIALAGSVFAWLVFALAAMASGFGYELD